jgi:hypothetical protein
MKALFLVLFFVPAVVFAQQPDVAPLQWAGDQLQHQSIHDLPGLMAADIFTVTKEFLIDSYKNYEKVVQVESTDMGIISGRALASIAYKAFPGGVWDVYYNFKYEIKDEKLRVTFTGFEVAPPVNNSLETYTKNALSGKYLTRLQGAAKDVIPGLGINLETMNTKLIEKMGTSDDW